MAFAIALIDWRSVFVPSVGIPEIILRGTIVYLFIFALFRLLRRESGALSISDLLVVVLVADAAQNAMGSEYKSVTEGAVLVLTVAGWDFFLDWLGYKFPGLRRLLRPPPLLLIKDGQMQRKNMRREFLTEEELRALLREQGVDKLSEVKKAHLEGDGKLSVINVKGKRKNQRDERGLA